MSSDPRNVGAHIDIYEETTEEQRTVRARRVRINGVDAGLTARGGPKVEIDNLGDVLVTVTFRPRSVSIHQEVAIVTEEEVQ